MRRVTAAPPERKAAAVVGDLEAHVAVRGREHSALSPGGGGPVSLWSRVDALGGTLTIDSSETGVHLEIVLPLVRASLSRGR